MWLFWITEYHLREVKADTQVAPPTMATAKPGRSECRHAACLHIRGWWVGSSYIN